MMQKRIAGTAITKKLAEDIVRRTHGLPDGAKCIDSFEDAWTRNIILVWEHESFYEVPEGCKIPLIDLTVKDGKL